MFWFRVLTTHVNSSNLWQSFVVSHHRFDRVTLNLLCLRIIRMIIQMLFDATLHRRLYCLQFSIKNVSQLLRWLLILNKLSLFSINEFINRILNLFFRWISWNIFQAHFKAMKSNFGSFVDLFWYFLLWTKKKKNNHHHQRHHHQG